jgi:hypothetical protein
MQGRIAPKRRSVAAGRLEPLRRCLDLADAMADALAAAGWASHRR